MSDTHGIISKGWWAVDLDGTLAEYTKWKGATHIGAPIPVMVDRVKMWLSQGRDVRIFTARVFPIGIDRSFLALSNDEYIRRLNEAKDARAVIYNWCNEHIGRVLEVQCWKDYEMITLYDDRAVQVEKNTGRLIGA